MTRLRLSGTAVIATAALAACSGAEPVEITRPRATPTRTIRTRS